ncbi:helix-turn-helix domain-containing protein [Sedimentibacter hydroxybenzoicus DSM 7310]|uniref:Helix-turn-helix domain-containing protein n=1 Tax=Sedimentibacter hydroxybenzoicus DSM 7310 TaxID=1123245 RepID=A0A974GVJ8_SEDHY|nr:AraC family transcriptional regulator [Sedimentibacter hydroxybenzoicus]NYB73434.1 helix-turn-helix domain-containing protein [Sedimentibacter hydroxybenzoicus DSM 7310]
MIDDLKDQQPGIAESFQAAFQNEELLEQIIELCPFQIEVFSPDGISVLVNQAALKEFNIPSADMVIGKYNLLKDPSIQAMGYMNEVKKAFQGETVFFSDIRAPLDDVFERYGINDCDLETIYHDITLFPIKDSHDKLSFVVAVLYPRRVYRKLNEIIQAKEYIESHWQETFDVNKTAKAVGLSRTHFSRLFKKHTGMTPHDYYISLKINKLKEKLLDSNLSVSQTFSACGLDYNGYFAKVFKERTGLSPSQYRKSAR